MISIHMGENIVLVRGDIAPVHPAQYRIVAFDPTCAGKPTHIMQPFNFHSIKRKIAEPGIRLRRGVTGEETLSNGGIVATLHPAHNRDAGPCLGIGKSFGRIDQKTRARIGQKITRMMGERR